MPQGATGAYIIASQEEKKRQSPQLILIKMQGPTLADLNGLGGTAALNLTLRAEH